MPKRMPKTPTSKAKIIAAAAVIIIAAALFLYKPAPAPGSVVVINRTGSGEVTQETVKRIDIAAAGEESVTVSNGGREPFRLSEIRVTIDDEPVECRWSVSNFIDVGNSAVCEFVSTKCSKGMTLQVAVPGSTEDTIC